MDFAQWLQSKQKQYHLTNYRIAKMAGVHQSTVAGWLKGTKPQEEKEADVRAAIKNYENSHSEEGHTELSKKNTPTGEPDERDEEFNMLISQLTAEEKKFISAQIKGILSNRE